MKYISYYPISTALLIKSNKLLIIQMLGSDDHIVQNFYQKISRHCESVLSKWIEYIICDNKHKINIYKI